MKIGIRRAYDDYQALLLANCIEEMKGEIITIELDEGSGVGSRMWYIWFRYKFDSQIEKIDILLEKKMDAEKGK